MLDGVFFFSVSSLFFVLLIKYSAWDSLFTSLPATLIYFNDFFIHYLYLIFKCNDLMPKVYHKAEKNED